jgi:DNA-binding transcriptional regulator YiaG
MSTENSNAFKVLWLRHISELAETIRQGELISPSDFASMMDIAFNHYGLDKQKLQTDMQIGRSTISKWCNNQATPTAPSRKAIREWILDEIKHLMQ